MKKLLYILLFIPVALFGQSIVSIQQDSYLEFYQGWNMFGYSCYEPIDVVLSFTSIEDKIVIVKDNSGNVYMPEFGFNGIGSLERNRGYQIKLTESITDFQFCPFLVPLVEGCMDATAFNHNSSANMDNGSCYPIVLGCLDPTAFNFNDYDGDGNSNGVTGINGVDVNTDDSTCIIYGCIDTEACNYNSEANTDNGVCEYPQEGYNCDGIDYISILGSKYWVVDSVTAEFMEISLNLLELPLVADDFPICTHDDIFYISDEFIVTKYDGIDECGEDEVDLLNLNGSWSIEGNILTIVREDVFYSLEVIQVNSDTLIIEFPFNFQVNGASEIIPARITLINIPPQLQVGDYAEGGIVFYVDETGQHGLVAAMEDLTEGATDPNGWGFNGYEWGCYGQQVNGADGKSIGTGYQNTIDIVNQGCSTDNGGITAAQAAVGSEINGYSDWYLPSLDELREIYNTTGNGEPEGNIGGFETSVWPYYWSSSEGTNMTGAWGANFADGGPSGTSKSNLFRVRVIRSF